MLCEYFVVKNGYSFMRFQEKQFLQLINFIFFYQKVNLYMYVIINNDGFVSIDFGYDVYMFFKDFFKDFKSYVRNS